MVKRSTRVPSKISPQFMARLNALRGDAMVQAIVLLPVSAGPKLATRQSSAARASAIAQTQQITVDLLDSIDAVLKTHGGERLSAVPNLLGGLVIRAGRDAILALAAQPAVKGIIEDQPIQPVR